MAKIKIRDLADLELFGRALAETLILCAFPPLFLRGSLGAGKTTLVKAIVSNLRGSENAECGSPSFNIYNFYPTLPPVLHCDLYRCGANLPEEIIEALEKRDQLLIVEWAEFFPASERPDDYLDINFNMDNDERLLEVRAFGLHSEKLLEYLLNIYKPITVTDQINPD